MTHPMTIGVLALAGGRARRFGSDKRVATLPNGQRVIDAFLDRVADSGLPILLCLGAEDGNLAASLEHRKIDIQLIARAAEGMGGTLAAGICRIPAWDGTLITLADMPWVEPATYREIAGHLSPAHICIPTHANRRGHPVGFGSSFYSDLAALGGDVGASGVLARLPSQIIELAVNDPHIQRDIDLPSDLPAA